MNQLPLQCRIMRQTLSNLTTLPHRIKTAVPNWFRRRSFAGLNSSIRFGTWVERRLNRALHFQMTFSLPLTSCLLKPWSNGHASSRKLITWGYLRLRLARPCVHLRWLAMTCDHFGRDQICPQVNASFLPFGHPTQVNASSVTEPVALK